ncbi:MAG: histidine phosphatase family protein [Patescibacteria group bacterium]
MPKIFIVRHGQDMDNANNILNGLRDLALTDLGRKQARATAQKLKDKNIGIIYSSPLKRALETARIMARALGVKKIIVNNDLRERDFGVLTGKSLADIPKYSKNNLPIDGTLYFLDVKKAESFPTVYERAKGVLEKIVAQKNGQNILIVTHGDFGKMLRAVFYNWDWERGLKTPHFGNGDVLELMARPD